MSGSRQGDFSRFSNDRRKHYRAVRMQQGRVQLDSDWNAQVDVQRYRQETETIDAVGSHGVPAAAAGFGLEVESCLDVGPKKSFVAIGGRDGCEFRSAPSLETGLTLEIRLQAGGDGMLWSRWLRSEKGIVAADSLRVERGRLHYSRPGQPDLVGESGDLGDRVHHVALAARVDVVTLYVDGEPVAEEASGFPPPALERNNFLLACGLDQSRPAFYLDALLFEFRVWGMRRTAAEIARDLDRVSSEAPDLLGHWPFRESLGTRIRDHSASCNHGVVRGRPRWLPREPTLTAGRYYVDGLLCENEEVVPYDRQEDYPGAEFPSGTGAHLIYLDAWERSVTALEDPDLREIALGGADTTTRSRALAQVKYLTLAEAPPEFPPRPETLPEWRRLVSGEHHRGRLRAHRQTVAGSSLGNHLYRIEIHHGGGCLRGPRPVAGDGASAAQVGEDGREVRLAFWRPGLEAGQPVELYDPEVDGDAGRWAIVAGVDPAAATLRLDREIDLRGDVVVRRLATFKWSRENGSRMYPIAGLEGGSRSLTLADSPRGLEDLCCGVWVEIVDDGAALRQEVRHLCQVDSVDGSRMTVSLVQDAPRDVGIRPERHPLLRVWDQSAEGGELLPQGVVLAVDQSDGQPLEEGLRVHFTGEAAYRSGDYWWLTTRALSQDVEWPRVDDEPLALPPQGVDHHYAPIALLVLEEDGFRLEDLRRSFRPLAEGAVSKAGDVMDGPLTVRSDVAVDGNLEVRGEARIGEIYGRLCGQAMVDTPQLVDGSVTLGKLSAEVGTVPAGYSILGASADPPPGYVYTRSRWTLFPEDPPWTDLLELPEPSSGPFHSAAVDGRIYVLLESGDFWKIDPERGSYRSCAEMPKRRRRFAMAAAEGKIYVAGGLDPVDRCRGTVLEYDPQLDHWRECEAMPTARCDLALAVCGGRLHALGGARELPLLGRLIGRSVTARHEVYDPRTDTWRRRRALPHARRDLAAAAAGNAVHAVGGERRWLFRLWGRIRTRRHEVYHPGNDRWLAPRAPLPAARQAARLVEVLGRIYAVGGRGPLGWLADCDRYDTATDHWSPQTALHEAIDSPGVAVHDGAIYVIGARRHPDAAGVLLEECRAATMYYVHRRQEVLPTPGARPGPRLATAEEESEPEPTDWSEARGDEIWTRPPEESRGPLR